jgi:sugar phosphate permease
VISFAGSQEHWQLPVAGPTRPWQAIFFIVGLPGIALAALVRTIPDPGRTARKQAASAVEFFAYLRQNRSTYMCHNFGFALLSFSSYGAAAWIPAFFARTHGWSAASIGIWFGAIVMVCGTAGIVSGGWLADKWKLKGRPDAAMRVGLLVSLVWIPPGLAMFLVPSPELSLGCLAIAQFFTSAPFGVAPSAIQQMTPPHLRGQASAVYLFVINLIGLGLGPTAVALVTDYVFANDNSVGYSLLIVTGTAHAISALLLWTGLARFRDSLTHNAPTARAPGLNVQAGKSPA